MVKGEVFQILNRDAVAAKMARYCCIKQTSGAVLQFDWIQPVSWKELLRKERTDRGFSEIVGYRGIDRMDAGIAIDFDQLELAWIMLLRHQHLNFAKKVLELSDRLDLQIFLGPVSPWDRSKRNTGLRFGTCDASKSLSEVRFNQGI